ncbi:MAG: hypothetical protein ABII00_15570 [Elusimicrobiota bacterium]
MKQAVTMSVVAALLLSVRLAAAETPAFDLDQGVDIKGVLEQVRQEAEEAPELTENHVGPLRYHTEEDCATFSFAANDPLTSESILLESRIFEERCQPRHDGGEDCHEYWVRTERRRVRVRVSGRGEMLPWERDIFRVCLYDNWLSARVIDASHEYTVDTPGWNYDIVEARAGAKIASEPDPAGVYAESFGFDPASGNFALTLRDRWASYYEGESLGLEIRLVRHHSGWFDGTVWKTELDIPIVGEPFMINFADFADEFAHKLRDGKLYYVKWRFKRIGQVSKPTWKGWWKTGQAAYQSGSSLASGFLSHINGSIAAESTIRPGSKACWLKDYGDGVCVYRCDGGGELTRPMPAADPFDQDGGGWTGCPQFIIPF